MTKTKRSNYKRKTWEDKLKEIENLTSNMEKRIMEYFQSPESIKEYLSFMAKFHNYSSNNCTLIESQFMGAQAVGSYKFWKDKGFSVKKGEKGIKVLVPKRTTYFERSDKEVKLKFATREEKEKIEKKEIPTYTRTSFDIGHVFDVSQTNATSKDLPDIFPNRWLEDSVENYGPIYQALEKMAEKHGIKIVEPHRELGAAKGVSYTLQKEVALNPRNSKLQNVKTLAHELAHAVLHTEETHNQYSSQEKEFQAEMVAYTVSSYFGLDTSEYSLPYLHHWTSGKELKEQERLLKEVRQTAHDFISVIEEELAKQWDKEKAHDHKKEDPFEEALIIQENYDMTSNGVEWENERFLTYLKSVDEEAYEKFIYNKKMHEREVENNEADILLIKYGHLSISEECYVSMNELKDFVEEKGIDIEDELSRANYLSEFNQQFKERYAAVDTKLLERPSILIQYSEAVHELKPNMIMPFVEGNLKMEKLEEKYQGEVGYFKTRYHLLFPKALHNEEKKVFIVNMDRLDIGDGLYVNPHHQVGQENNLDPRLLEVLNKEVISKLTNEKKLKILFKGNQRKEVQELEP
ncbi:ArdC-like ssDNA-binding domain-containing protein [Lederbergia citrea]|uniref:ArdC-like ssDNA-binding domain-containing protein n=1 Tax=Lederbergia citrea TaxID=2833581 RepID=UPI001BC97025|nr:ImmA/IrrE family metallo-endopeptidase [Lederbergia citrea]MBS4203653.1 ImmA/IrrE family metallo-endopeptidase [Lederbergia citrea]